MILAKSYVEEDSLGVLRVGSLGVTGYPVMFPWFSLYLKGGLGFI